MNAGSRLILALVVPLFVACAGDTGPTVSDGPELAIDIAALSLDGVGDVVWDLQVVHDGAPTEVVWQRRISSSGYGDGAGSASYIGTCDADFGDNEVRVWVVGVYQAAVTSTGAFDSGDPTDVVGSVLEFQNPTTDGPLTRTVACTENTDVAVHFDVALMRPAQQGFFDIAVNFNNIFCSAKFDCCNAGGDGVCDGGGTEDIELLFDADGDRRRTFVLGLACTAGTATDVMTTLYLDDIQIDCDVNSDGNTFLADVTLDPNPELPGNLCTAESMSGCAAVTEAANVDADTYLFQAAVYRGLEELTSDGAEAHKLYWNVALGVEDGVDVCTIRTRASADDNVNLTDGFTGGTVAKGFVYPFIQFDVDVDQCGSEELTFGADAMVSVDYTDIGAATATDFAHGFSGGLCGGPCVAVPFAATGADQSWVVPDEVEWVIVKAWGAGGGGGGGFAPYEPVGGGGGYAAGRFDVTTGETLTVVVGGGGTFGLNGTTGGYGGGGTVTNSGGTANYEGSGGGRSAVRRAGTELVTAGGGGGGGGQYGHNHGGGGGGLVGEALSEFCGGGGGSQSAGGVGTLCYTYATPHTGESGSALAGGANDTCGGGGGGGWYGGAGGSWNTTSGSDQRCGGGGGGSGHVDALVIQGELVAGSGATPGNSGDAYYLSGVGVGGAHKADGGDGYVVILYPEP